MNTLRWSLSVLSVPLFAPSAAFADHSHQPVAPLVQTVRQATAQFQDVQLAVAAGYAPLLGCVSGPDEGAMGIHYLNAGLVGDGALDPARPEVLIYEPLPDGGLRLVGVEYLTFFAAWHGSDDYPPATPSPVLAGQVLVYSAAPNRYGAPAHYDLHVWAWKDNPRGTFAEWNPNVSCDAYDPE